MLENIFSIITIVAVIAVFVFYFFVKQKEGKDWIYAVYFLTVLITGTAIYAAALSFDGEPSGLTIFVFARAFALSLKSFGGDFGISSLSALASTNTLFGVAAFIHYIAAVILSALVIIKIFGKNLINKLHVFVNSHRSKYIVVGTSKQAEVFLQSFHYKKRRRTTLILEASEKQKKRDFVFKGFAVVVIKDIQASAKSWDGSPAQNFKKETYDALKAAGFHRNRHDTTIIAFSGDDELNLLVATLVTDHISGIIKPVKNQNGRLERLTDEQERDLDAIKLSAHIMYGMFERTEHFAFAEYSLGRVRFFNPYDVRARKFLSENPVTKLIPDMFINKEKGRLYNASDKEGGIGRAHRIGNVFVGYGATNRHILKKSICNNQLLGTDYHALIIDKGAKELQKQFENAALGLFNKPLKEGVKSYGAELDTREAYYPNPNEEYDILFEDHNVLSSDFFCRIIAEIEGDAKENKLPLDFVSVILALGDDKLSIETALELRQKLYERRLLRGEIGGKKYDRVRIFVKIRKESFLSDNRLLNDENDIDNKIVVFGANNEVLNEDYVVHEKLDFIAKRIANDYWMNAGSENQTSNIITKWDALTEFKRNSNRYAAMAIQTKLNLLGFEMIESSVGTAEDVIKEYEEKYGTERAVAQRKAKAEGQFVDFAERDAKDNIIDNARNNLARMEHQRWNTIHLVAGWTKLPIREVSENARQDEKAKQHACITTFEGLGDLRKKQADEAVKHLPESERAAAYDKALSAADTVCYDFDVMDRLFQHLAGESPYAVIRKG